MNNVGRRNTKGFTIPSLLIDRIPKSKKSKRLEKQIDDEMVRYLDYLGVGGGGPTGVAAGAGLESLVVAIDETAVSAGDRGIAIGHDASQPDDDGVAIGHNALGSQRSVVIGSDARATGDNVILMGYNNDSSGTDSVLMAPLGFTNFGSVSNTVAIGTPLAVGSSSVGIGRAYATSALAIAIGYQAEAQTTGAIAIGSDAGNTSGSRGNYYIAIGYNNNQGSDDIGTDSISIGRGQLNDADYGIVLGSENSVSTGDGAMAIGRACNSFGEGSIMMGYNTSDEFNFLAGSFELMYLGDRYFKSGKTMGTQVLVDPDPATNLTDVEDGCLAYDSTDDELQLRANGAWVVVNVT